VWTYEKKLEYPVRVFKNDIGMAKFLMAQYGGPYSWFYSSSYTLNPTLDIVPSSAR
jgi:spore coat protein JC